MAKIKKSLFKISGKLDGKAFVNSNKYPPHVRALPEEGSRKDEPQLKENYSRAGVLNGLASEINNIVRQQAGIFRDSWLYQDMLSRFAKAKDAGTNRFLLLLELGGLEVNPKYPLNKLGHQQITINPTAKNIVVNLNVQGQPGPGTHHADCYRYELVLLHWDKTKRKAGVAIKKSAWWYMKEGKPEFEFLFPRPAGLTHWVLLLRQRLGVQSKVLEMFPCDGMQVVEAGTVDKKELALWKKRDEQRAAKLAEQKKKKKESVEEEEGVRPKRVRK